MKTFQVDFIDPSGKEDFALFDAESIEAAESMFENEFGTACAIGNISDYDEEPEYDDSMDGDFDSAMASAGFGTDEDYGYYGEE